MNCPSCKSRMIFNRDIKDYYCNKCKKSLKDLEQPKEALERPEEPAQQVPVRPPEVGTIKGILFLTIGSVIQLIAPWICQAMSIIGIFLFIFGFYLVFQDRRSQSNEHISNVKIGAIIVIMWIVVNILTIAYSYYISTELSQDIAGLDDKDVVPNSVLARYLDASLLLTILGPLSIGLLALFRYLSIKSLIQEKLKNILTIIVVLIIIAGLSNMYLSLDYSQQIISGLNDPEFQDNTTKEELMVGNINYNTSTLNPNYTLLYGILFLSISTEAIMILCFYWTYSYQRQKSLRL